MKDEKPTWSEVRASIKKLLTTLDAVENQIKGRNPDAVEDFFSKIFGKTKPATS